MKNILKALTVLAMIGGLAACGANEPFQRGEKLKAGGAGGSGSEKPGDGSGDDTGSGDGSDGGDTGGGGGEQTPALNRATYDRQVKPLLEESCTTCHDNPGATFDAASALVVVGNLERSVLYQMATGNGTLESGRKHRKVLAPDSDEARILANWINGL